MVYTKKQVESHILEKVLGVVMLVLGVAAVWIFVAARGSFAATDLAIIQILLIIVLAILAQTVILIKIYEKK
jgi:hypothetical protein